VVASFLFDTLVAVLMILPCANFFLFSLDRVGGGTTDLSFSLDLLGGASADLDAVAVGLSDWAEEQESMSL
jgi:hypothetical protein